MSNQLRISQQIFENSEKGKEKMKIAIKLGKLSFAINIIHGNDVKLHDTFIEIIMCV